MKKLFESKFFLVIVAFLISIVLWCYVVLGTNPTYTSWVGVDNVVYEGLSDITDKGFFFIGDLDRMVSNIQVKATGARSLVTKTNDDYSAKIDFTGIKGAGEYELRVKVTAPSGVEVKRVKPESITVKIDSGKTKKVGTNLKVFGGNTEEFEITPIDETISVSGPSSVISKIADFDVKINTDDITKTGEAMYRATPLDSYDNEVIDGALTFDSVVKVNIARVKTVDIIVDESIVPLYIRDLYNVSVIPDVRTVKIVGDDSDLEEIDKIEANFAQVMLNPAENPQKAKVKLILPEKVKLAKGESDTVTLSVEYNSIED